MCFTRFQLNDEFFAMSADDGWSMLATSLILTSLHFNINIIIIVFHLNLESPSSWVCCVDDVCVSPFRGSHYRICYSFTAVIDPYSQGHSVVSLNLANADLISPKQNILSPRNRTSADIPAAACDTKISSSTQDKSIT